ncbi:MAG: MHS family MFS transporter [Pseudolabrys sp.]|nr:MHS family MFS transporter [Pseudolabrys sp.]
MTAFERTSGALAAVSPRDREVRRVALASLVGTTIEWYDFLIYATMAGVIFNQYFFPKGDAFVNTLLAYGTFAAGFLIRPFGGLLFGHFGDRIGRKPLLVLTLMIMGAATFLIGLLPTYESIGVWAPVLLLALRLIQGIALGGEWGGAVLMSYEFAEPGERAYYASFPQIGLAIGLCCSTGVVTLLSYMLSNADFVAWGWRVAFMLSIVLLAVGLFIRLRVLETPEFTKAQANRQVARVPMWEVIRDYPGAVLLGWGARLIDGIAFTVYAIFPLSYLTSVVKIPRTTVLAGITLAAFVLIFTIPFSSRLADRGSRKRMYIVFSLINGLAAFPAFWLMHYSGSGVLASAAIVVALGILWAPVYGPQAAMFCDLFDTRVRYTGVSLVYQIGAIFSVSLTPVAATALLHANGDKPWLVAAYVAVAGVISAVCAGFMRRVP